MWNCKVLPPPPYCEIKTYLTSADRGCLLEARKHLKKSENAICDHVKLLKSELYVTKRIIYKLSNQFRSDKALQTLKQVHACMKRLEAVNLEKQLPDTLQIVDRVPSSDDAEVYLTSRQVLEYQLVMLQGTGALLRQMVQYCQKTFIHVREHLELGNMIPQNLVMLALTSRVWFVCNSLGLYVCKWYSKLYPCLAVLKPTAVRWLQDEELPGDLTEWLTELFADIGLPEHFCIELINSAEAEKVNGSLPSNVEFLETADHEDIGEPVQRKQVVAEPINSTEVQHRLTQKDTLRKRKFKIDKERSTVNKKQKLSVDDQSSDTTVDSGIRESAGNKKSKKHKQLKQVKASLTYVEEAETVTLPEVNTKDVRSVKAHLETVLNTYKDVDNLAKQVNSGTFQICGVSVKLTRSGRKKVMKNIDKWKKMMQDRGSLSETEKLFVKKVTGPLSELLVKNCQNQSEQENEGKTAAGADDKLNSNKVKIHLCSQDHDSVVADDCVHKTNDVHKASKLGAVQQRRKKKKGKADIEVDSTSGAEVGRSVRTEVKSQSDVNKKAKKRKRKPKRK